MTKANLDKLQATTNGNIESVIAEVDLPNGSVISLGEAYVAPMGLDREVVKAIAPDVTKELLLVVHPEVKYDARDRWDELDYVTPKGKVTRAYHLTVGDKFQVEQVLFAATPAVNEVITGNPATYGYAVAGGTEQTTFIVERLTKFGHDRRDMALLRVLSV